LKHWPFSLEVYLLIQDVTCNNEQIKMTKTYTSTEIVSRGATDILHLKNSQEDQIAKASKEEDRPLLIKKTRCSSCVIM
jgi:hypothetical protein